MQGKISKTKLILLSLMLLFSTMISISAEREPIDLNRTGSVMITLLEDTDEHSPVLEAEFTFYHIADIVKKGSGLAYQFTSDYEASGASLVNLNAPGLADHLVGYVALENLKGDAVGITGKDGKIVFSNLPLGLYLVVQTKTSSRYYPAVPFLISLPMTDADGNWIYDVDAAPKLEIKPVNPNNYTHRTVKKIWMGENNHRPDHITVSLFCDGNKYDTVILNDENNWEYTWWNLENWYRWTVVEEEVPEEYHVSYSTTGLTITITNSTDEPLIHTGQLNWPIPILAAAGMILFVLGWILVFAMRDKNVSK